MLQLLAQLVAGTAQAPMPAPGTPMPVISTQHSAAMAPAALSEQTVDQCVRIVRIGLTSDWSTDSIPLLKLKKCFGVLQIPGQQRLMICKTIERAAKKWYSSLSSSSSSTSPTAHDPLHVVCDIERHTNKGLIGIFTDLAFLPPLDI